MRAIATVGASGSGKSTWAKAFMREQEALGAAWTELNKDDLRVELLALRGTKPEDVKAALRAWSYDPEGADETEVKALLMTRLQAAVESGAAGAIFSNTNLDGGAQPRAQLAKLGLDPSILEVKAFPLDFDECVRRDAGRFNKVGPEVIESQFRKLALLGMGFPELPAAKAKPAL